MEDDPPLESEESLRLVCLTGTVTCQVLVLTMWRVRGMVAALVPPCSPKALHRAPRVGVGSRSRSRSRSRVVARCRRDILGAPYSPFLSQESFQYCYLRFLALIILV